MSARTRQPIRTFDPKAARLEKVERENVELRAKLAESEARAEKLARMLDRALLPAGVDLGPDDPTDAAALVGGK